MHADPREYLQAGIKVMTENNNLILKHYVAQLAENIGHKPKACAVTFGCQMNARDSEKLLGVLKEAGYEETENEEEADFLIYNTCTVRDNADQHLYGRLGQAGRIKQNRPHMKIAVCGCMMQEQSCVDKLQKSYRFVNLIFGTFNLSKFPEYLQTLFESDRQLVDIWKEAEALEDGLPSARKYPFKSGVNIMYGCNNFCTYCIVPYVRGRERSRKAEDILAEIRRLADDGVREVMLLGQNVNSYGKDKEGFCSFPELLEQVCGIDGIERVRFMTSHPKDLSEELIDVIARNPKVARHIHLPLQSGSDRILKRMNRHYTKAAYLDLVERIHAKIPDAAITTDLIVGFPGETPEDVDETIDVVRKARYNNAFTFIYSPRNGTPAASMGDQVPEKQAHEQFDRLLKVVQETAKASAAGLEGQVESVLVESEDPQQEGYLQGRLSNNMLVHFEGTPAKIGSFTNVKLTQCKGFYYYGREED